MSEYQLFLAFEREEYIYLQDLPKIRNYICGHLVLLFPNQRYFQTQYNYINKLHAACHWKQKRGLPVCSKKGEAICDRKPVNFFEDKKHKRYICSIA